MSMNFHAQDLRSDADQKRWWRRYGRCWLRPNWMSERYNSPDISIEWSIPSSLYSFRINVGGEDRKIQLGIGCGLFGLYLGFNNFISCPDDYSEERTTGVSWCEDTLLFYIWHNDMAGWSSRDGFEGDRFRWQHFTFCPADFFLGRSAYSTRTISEESALVTMPEFDYPAQVRIFESTWKRPRWPWPRRMVRTEVEMEVAIPVPGKGENSWDMDDDCIYSQTSPSTTVESAIANIQASATRTRLQHGEKDWVPDEGWEHWTSKQLDGSKG